MKLILDYIDIYRIPTPPRLTALMRQRELAATDPELAELLALIEAAIAHDEALFEREMLRRAHRSSAEHGVEARELDRRLDRFLGVIDGALELRGRLGELEAELSATAIAMRERLFPEGLGGLTQKSYIDQAHATRRLLRRYRENPAFVALAESIGLDRIFDEVARLNAAYTATLNTAEAPPSREEIEAGRAEGLRRFGEIIIRILGRFPTEDPRDQARRSALMEPVERQVERLRKLYRERRRGEGDDEALSAELDPPLGLEDAA